MKREIVKKELQTISLFLILGFLYYLWLSVTNIGIPCIFKLVTGWQCPGCGITHLCVDLLHFRFAQAYQANQFLFVTGPLLLIEWIYVFWLKVTGKALPKWNQRLVLLYLIALIIFGIGRNLL